MLSILKPWRLFVLIQFIGALVFAVVLLFNSDMLLAMCVATFSAVLLSWHWHRESWWRLIHLGFLPLVLFAQQLNLPSYLYLVAFILCWIIFGRIAQSRVPLFLSETEALEHLAERLPHGASLLDVGAGTGRVLAYLQRVRPDLILHGTEIAFVPWLYGRLTLDQRINWGRTDYNKIDFSGYQCVYAYLSPAVMCDLWHKATCEMQPGTLLISNSFEIEQQEPDEVIPLNDWKSGKLLIWHM
ncbi:methyltransferase type 12 [Chitinibacter fontanus]|uniref:Methyltransferase type 12 n=1 Tax=Chitinibacter fontanus TaxID=1737446 RepID=A0A7D5V6I4_9NEIS|nr:methyltransferase type 12 [Chitinibacter fontanus]QLI80076.1 methyltransferase type 12 [Chitinibacter fontanus]